jgi:gliding motility-associated protein GldM
MGHGKETPRQKMIGMMYLVLTAMLALNVAKEVLNAFVLVDSGLVTTTENFTAKNKSLYNTFAAQYELNPAKVGDWKDKADEVHKRSDDLFDFLHECKTDILVIGNEEAILTAGVGGGAQAADDHGDDHGEDHGNGIGGVNWDEVKAKDNTDHPAEVMIVKGKASELKAKIDEHREYLLSLIEDKEKYAGTVEAVEGVLNTGLPPVHLEHGGKKVVPTWETTYFEHLPLAAVITLLSNMQANVRNAEAEMIDFLLEQIGEGDVGFNAIEAVVVAERSLVFPGEEYEAKILLAAYDSTKAPEVILEDGTSLEVEAGKGVYRSTSNALGTRTWGGTIRLESDGGAIIERDFSGVYEVAEANATVSATAMNVFYRGIPNPVAVSAGGVAESSVRVNINNPHSIRRRGPGDYTVNPGSTGDRATVSVYADIDGESKLMTRMDFRVWDLPTPVAKITGSRGGQANLRVSDLVGLDIMEAEAEGFMFEVDFKITTFTMGFTDASGIFSKETSDGEKFTSQMKALFRTMRAGSRITLEDIKAIGPDGKVRSLSPINITVR